MTKTIVPGSSRDRSTLTGVVEGPSGAAKIEYSFRFRRSPNRPSREAKLIGAALDLVIRPALSVQKWRR
jgi:hypothetical protein